MQRTQATVHTIPEDIKKIITIQRYLRSKIRTDLHIKHFKGEPPRNASIINLPSPYQETLGVRLQKIIDELSEIQAVINGRKLNHFTVIKNLQSIIRTKYMMGNKTLKRDNIDFTGNALSTEDVSDQDTLCFAPARVDSLAFIADKYNRYAADRAFKPNLCSIICDVSNLHYPGNNQFFKITDFLSSVSFFKDFTVNNRLSITLCRQISSGFSRGFDFIIQLDGEKYVHTFQSEELFFYGHLEDINRFCLTKLFDCLNDVQNYYATLTREKLLDYFKTLNDDEIKKVLVIFAQALTYFSEYNLHSYCSLNDIRINEIRMYDQQIKYQLQGLDATEYETFLNSFANSEWSAPLIKQCEMPLPKENNLNIHKDLTYAYNIGKDFSKLPASLFAQNKYIETRGDVNNTEDSIMNMCNRY